MRAYGRKYADLNPEQKLKWNTRSRSFSFEKHGSLKREPCSVCGEHEQRHHPDYTDPRHVGWLCEKHHRELHKHEQELEHQEFMSVIRKHLQSTKTTDAVNREERA
jgi:hypothetical protein